MVRAQVGQEEIASLSGVAEDARYFQTSEPVQPGSSSALVDWHGNVRRWSAAMPASCSCASAVSGG